MANREPAVLLVIDIQNFYFEGGRLALAGPVEASRNARRVLDRFRARGWPVIHVQHLPKGVEAPCPDSGDTATRIHAELLPLPDEPVVVKHHANPFRGTGLLDALRARAAGRVVICGMQTHMCVEAAARAAADFGFAVTVIHDACATRTLSFGVVEVPVSHVHATALAAIASMYGRVIATDELLAEMP